MALFRNLGVNLRDCLCDVPYTPNEIKTLQAFKKNLEEGMDFCLSIAQKQPYQGENLASIPSCVERQTGRLKSIYANFEKNVEIAGSE